MGHLLADAARQVLEVVEPQHHGVPRRAHGHPLLRDHLAAPAASGRRPPNTQYRSLLSRCILCVWGYMADRSSRVKLFAGEVCASRPADRAGRPARGALGRAPARARARARAIAGLIGIVFGRHVPRAACRVGRCDAGCLAAVPSGRPFCCCCCWLSLSPALAFKAFKVCASVFRIHLAACWSQASACKVNHSSSLTTTTATSDSGSGTCRRARLPKRDTV